MGGEIVVVRERIVVASLLHLLGLLSKLISVLRCYGIPGMLYHAMGVTAFLGCYAMPGVLRHS